MRGVASGFTSENSPSIASVALRRARGPLRTTIRRASSATSTDRTGGISSKSPIMDCRLPGLRIAATLPPVAVHGPAMSIRRHSSQTFTLESYVERGSFNPTVDVSRKVGSSNRPSDETVGRGREGLAEFLKWMVQSKCNFIVSGSTSSGKTALLNALAAYIPADDRVLTIEDTAELKMKVLNWLAFEANQTYGVDIRALVRHALRNRPDRIWVGEIRGAEACDMLDAYNTGHPGSTVSYHSDTAALALSRLESMVRKAPEAANWPLEDLRRQIASTFKFVVHASKLEGQRGPSEVIEITGIENGQYITRSIFKKQIIYTN